MKIITIGDIHGKQDWKSIDPSLWDKIIFVGDYCDAYDKSDSEIYSNLLEIIEFKKNNLEKVELLLGNHDANYMDDSGIFSCSGYRPSMATALHNTFQANKDLFQVSFQIQNWIWSHAGISQDWLQRNSKKIAQISNSPKGKIEQTDLSTTLNQIWNSRHRILFADVGYSRGGDCKTGSPLWCDQKELLADCIPDITQVVGHTRLGKVKEIQFFDFPEKQAKLYFTDILDTILNCFLELEIE